MKMDVKYRSYDENKPLLIVIGVVALIGVLWAKIFEDLLKISFKASLWIMALYFLLLIALGIMMRAKSRFIADDYSVAFTRMLSRRIVINYIDIDEITVYNQIQRVRGQYNYHDIYIEVIAFKTFDGKEYIFKNIMDISPDSHIAAMLGMDKIFEMGKFKILQRFIEQKKREFYYPDYTAKRS